MVHQDRRAGGRQKVLVIDNASIQADDLVCLCERLVNRHGRSVSFGYGGHNEEKPFKWSSIMLLSNQMTRFVYVRGW